MAWSERVTEVQPMNSPKSEKLAHLALHIGAIKHSLLKRKQILIERRSISNMMNLAFRTISDGPASVPQQTHVPAPMICFQRCQNVLYANTPSGWKPNDEQTRYAVQSVCMRIGKTSRTHTHTRGLHWYKAVIKRTKFLTFTWHVNNTHYTCITNSHVIS